MRDIITMRRFSKPDILIGAMSEVRSDTSVVQIRLNRYNVIMSVIHLASSIAILSISTINKLKYCFPLYVSYPSWDIPYPDERCFSTVNGNFNDCTLTIVREHVSSIEITMLLFIFTLLSSFAHAYIAYYSDYYMQLLREKGNWVRWVEYSWSASVMIVIIAVIVGVDDLYSVMLLFAMMWLVNMCGLLQDWNIQFTAPRVSTSVEKERLLGNTYYNREAFVNVNEGAERHFIVIYAPTIIGWILYLVMWSILFTSFGYTYDNNDSTPEFVIVVVCVLFVLFTTFGVNQLIYLSGRIGYVRSEVIFIYLSLVSKLTLVWMLYFSVFARLDPNGEDEIVLGTCL